MYARSDSMESRASAWHWKTSASNKMPMMNQLRDAFLQKQLFVRSTHALKEMQIIVQDGIEIAAEGNGKDDRVMALALAVRAWIDMERSVLRAQGRTKEIEHKKLLPLDREEIMEIFSKQMVVETLAANTAAVAAQRKAAGNARKRWNW